MALPDFSLAEATTNTNSTHRRPFYAHYFQHPLQSTNLAEMQNHYHNNSANLMQCNFSHKEMEVFPPNYSNSALPRQLLGGSGCSSFVPKCSSTSTSALPPNIGSSQEKHHPLSNSSTEEDKEEGEGEEGSLTTRAEITSAFSQPTRKRTMQKPDSKNGGESEDSSITKRQKCSSRKPCEQLRGKAFTTKGSKSPPPDCKNSSASPTYKDSNKQSKSGGAAVTQDYVHVRARRGQATDSHSLAERVRREKISERMRFLQDLVPGCNKAIGKAMMLDEIINYVQSLQHQVEFLSMKLAALSPRMDFDINSLLIGEMMLLNGATTNSMATTIIGSDIAETVQMGNMCDMVYNPSASNMSFQMLLQSPLPPDSTNIGDPTSLPIKACENAMLNNANLAINLDQSYMDPQLTSTWDPRSMPGRENMVFYSNPTVSMTEPVGNPLV